MGSKMEPFRGEFKIETTRLAMDVSKSTIKIARGRKFSERPEETFPTPMKKGEPSNEDSP